MGWTKMGRGREQRETLERGRGEGEREAKMASRETEDGGS